MSFQGFIGDKSNHEDEQKWPSGKNVGTAKIKHQEGRKESSKEKLQNIYKPKMCFAWIFLITFFAFHDMNQRDKNSNDQDMP